MTVETLAVSLDSPQEGVLLAAAERLGRGELLIFPTDTLYALGGRALDAPVARAVRAAKGRSADKPLPLVVADIEQARLVACDVPDVALRLAELFWPGPLTVILPAAALVPAEVSAGTSSVALRVPDATLLRRLCGLAGPLIATSANREGGAPAATCQEALRAVGGSVGLALDGGPARTQEPSTIVDLRGGAPRLVRSGALPWEAVLRALGRIADRIEQR